MEKTARSRRRLLKGLALFAVCGTLLWRYLTPSSRQRKKVLLEVDKNEIPLRGALVYKNSRVAVIRRENEIYALSLICTHLGCTVNVSAENLTCPCHGSVFDRDGKVLKGPSDKPLKRLEIEEHGDRLVILA